jgi:hypothetical protein
VHRRSHAPQWTLVPWSGCEFGWADGFGREVQAVYGIITSHAVRVPLRVWCPFGVLVLVMLAIDLGLDSRQRRRPMTLGAAAMRSAAWIVISLLFGLIVLALFGPRPAVPYYSAYLLAKSLSVDNHVVFALIFSELGISAVYQHRVLLYGVLGAQRRPKQQHDRRSTSFLPQIRCRRHCP